MKKIFQIIVIFFSFLNVSFSKEIVYMSLKPNKVNLRSGPNKEFPILYIYQLKFMPVKITGEYDNWFKIVDKDGDVGWISEQLLSKARTIITLNDMQLLYSNYNKEAYPTYRLGKNVIAKFLKCKENRCKVKIGKIKGWLNKSDIWGFDED